MKDVAIPNFLATLLRTFWRFHSDVFRISNPLIPILYSVRAILPAYINAPSA